MADEYDAFSNEYMDPRRPTAWDGKWAASIIRGFWATVKAGILPPYGIQKIFITGVSPLCLADNTSGFNISTNISFDAEFAGFCGLTRADIRAALEAIYNAKGIAEGEAQGQVEKCLTELMKYANGFHFCDYQEVEPVFNTDTCLGYLRVSHRIDVLQSLLGCKFQLSVLTMVWIVRLEGQALQPCQPTQLRDFRTLFEDGRFLSGGTRAYSISSRDGT